MLNFNLDWKPYTFTWDGSEISVELKTITTDQMLVLAQYLGMNGTLIKLTNEEIAKQIYQVQKAVQPFINDIIRNVRGLTVNEKPITPEQLCSESVFGSLLYHLINETYIQSLPKGPKSESEKNLQ